MNSVKLMIMYAVIVDQAHCYTCLWQLRVKVLDVQSTAAGSRGEISPSLILILILIQNTR